MKVEEEESPDDTWDSWEFREESLFGREESWAGGTVKDMR